MKTTIVLIAVLIASISSARPPTDPVISAWVDSVSNANKIESLQKKIHELDHAKVSKYGDVTIVSGMPHTLVLPFSEKERKDMLAKVRSDLKAALIERKKLQSRRGG